MTTRQAGYGIQPNSALEAPMASTRTWSSMMSSTFGGGTFWGPRLLVGSFVPVPHQRRKNGVVSEAWQA